MGGCSVKQVLLVSVGLLGAVVVVVLLLTVSGAAGAVALAAILFGGAIALLAGSHAESTTYHCPHCGHDFKISGATDLFSPHVPTAKYLLCPKCDRFGWARAKTDSSADREK